MNRFGLALLVAVASACGPDAAEVAGDGAPAASESSEAAKSLPTCGTRPLTETELAADAARVAAFKARGGPKKQGLTTITTYVHVIHDGGVGRVSEGIIREQIRVLNAAYAAHGFQFALAPSAPGNPNPDYTDDAQWFRDLDEVGFKTALKEGSGDDLNLYVNSGAGLLGYAYYPNVVGTQYDVLDGVVLAYGTLPGAMQAGISDIPGFVYNLGDTGTHEVGHYLGLVHTFEGGCSSWNDLVDDTPRERTPDFYCTAGRNTCADGSGPVLYDPIHNFMDYSDDRCLFEFTKGQAERMAVQWAMYRSGH